jgi:hypothetical protein
MISTQDDEIEKPRTHEREGRYRQWGGFEGMVSSTSPRDREKRGSYRYQLL